MPTHNAIFMSNAKITEKPVIKTYLRNDFSADDCS